MQAAEKPLTLSVPVLEEKDDWSTWNDKIRNQLVALGYSSVIETAEPQQDTDLPYEGANWTKYQRDFKEKQKRALGIIRDRCGYNAKQLILRHADPFNALSTLSENFAKGGAGEFARISNLWNLITMDNSKGGISLYGSEVRRLWNRFAEIDPGLKIPEPHAVQKFIAGLPESFELFVTSFNQTRQLIPKTVNNTVEKTAVTLGEVISSAEDFETRRNASSTNELGLYSGYNRKPKGRGIPRDQCKHCDRRHKGECFMLNPSKAPEWWKKKEAERRDGKRKVDDNEETTLVCESAPKKTKGLVVLTNDCAFSASNASGESFALHKGSNLFDTWIVDSGCISHLVGRRDVFTSMTPIKGHSSRGIGGNAIAPTHIGTIRIPAKINNKLYWLNITNVKYSAQAGVNLLSLEQMWPSFDEITASPTGLTLVKGSRGFVTRF
ncbi:unnamed protein product [Zymoseptoria tritici ST99CH_1E4]|uniref:Retrovirus-related Pol polyprotein from transposon TNT 1-94-like beta-barrel domain-containing protein n=1 Tax=Zymoseptoria tritici ST99CH_1E4 TaxID=1276532 RepID=A0A2H1H8U7_ZYMTR|nr:unnamed protein product [Zymoseptoria tritici ST99CH_1E4]